MVPAAAWMFLACPPVEALLFSAVYARCLPHGLASPAPMASPRLQHKSEAELRGHSEGVTNLAWHPTHPDKLASIAGPEKSVR